MLASDLGCELWLQNIAAYVVGDDEHFNAFRASVCDSDADATVWARQLVDGHDVELWCGERFVLRLSSPVPE
jgi:hypothetical protein